MQPLHSSLKSLFAHPAKLRISWRPDGYEIECPFHPVGFGSPLFVEGKHFPEIDTPSEKPGRRSSMKVAWHCSQVASHAALASAGSLMAQSQRVAAQHTNRCMRTGTAPANVLIKTKGKPIMSPNVRPVGDRILVESVEEKENKGKKGEIIIPDIAKEKPMESVVVALGTGKTDDNGRKVPFEVRKGDRVLVSRYGGTEIKLDGKDYKILNGDDILAVIE
jgi:chaperonin GroES